MRTMKGSYSEMDNTYFQCIAIITRLRNFFRQKLDRCQTGNSHSFGLVHSINDITQFDAPQKFSLWHDRALFHFLTDQSDREIYVKTLKNALKPEGHLIIATFAIGGPEKCSGLEIVQYDSEKMIAELGDNFQLSEERKEVHITPANKEQEFIFFRFLKVPKDSYK